MELNEGETMTPALLTRVATASLFLNLRCDLRLFLRMDIYRHPTFDMACEKFDLVADRLEIGQVERRALSEYGHGGLLGVLLDAGRRPGVSRDAGVVRP